MQSQCHTNEAFTCVHHLYIIARVSADAVLHGCDNSMITCRDLFTQLHIRDIIPIISKLHEDFIIWSCMALTPQLRRTMCA